ncbi:hypothetical protein FSP39_009125 [Pinctada imbricata]|uniref:Uncharacterized protein n=1 Tax=Pinctada imbricata TaxID=66713 RepID=A0AA89BYC5_PINIB|nr:hypothetical protein FSP39_009125 [Pinctada imbricata]
MEQFSEDLKSSLETSQHLIQKLAGVLRRFQAVNTLLLLRRNTALHELDRYIHTLKAWVDNFDDRTKTNIIEAYAEKAGVVTEVMEEVQREIDTLKMLSNESTPFLTHSSNHTDEQVERCKTLIEGFSVMFQSSCVDLELDKSLPCLKLIKHKTDDLPSLGKIQTSFEDVDTAESMTASKHKFQSLIDNDIEDSRTVESSKIPSTVINVKSSPRKSPLAIRNYASPSRYLQQQLGKAGLLGSEFSEKRSSMNSRDKVKYSSTESLKSCGSGKGTPSRRLSPQKDHRSVSPVKGKNLQNKESLPRPREHSRDHRGTQFAGKKYSWNEDSNSNILSSEEISNSKQESKSAFSSEALKLDRQPGETWDSGDEKVDDKQPAQDKEVDGNANNIDDKVNETLTSQLNGKNYDLPSASMGDNTAEVNPGNIDLRLPEVNPANIDLRLPEVNPANIDLRLPEVNPANIDLPSSESSEDLKSTESQGSADNDTGKASIDVTSNRDENFNTMAYVGCTNANDPINELFPENGPTPQPPKILSLLTAINRSRSSSFGSKSSLDQDSPVENMNGQKSVSSCLPPLRRPKIAITTSPKPPPQRKMDEVKSKSISNQEVGSGAILNPISHVVTCLKAELEQLVDISLGTEPCQKSVTFSNKDGDQNNNVEKPKISGKGTHEKPPLTNSKTMDCNNNQNMLVGPTLEWLHTSIEKKTLPGKQEAKKLSEEKVDLAAETFETKFQTPVKEVGNSATEVSQNCNTDNAGKTPEEKSPVHQSDSVNKIPEHNSPISDSHEIDRIMSQRSPESQSSTLADLSKDKLRKEENEIQKNNDVTEKSGASKIFQQALKNSCSNLSPGITYSEPPISKHIRCHTKGRFNYDSQIPPIPCKFKFKFGHFGTNKSGLKFPIGVCTNSKGEIIVADTGNHSVKMFDAEGNFLREIDCELVRPSAVLVNKRDEIFVKDDLAVHIFNEDCRFLRSIGKGILTKPFGLAITPNDLIITVDVNWKSPQVFILSQDGRDLRSFPFTTLLNYYPQSKCRFLAVHKDILVISDLGASCVYIADSMGQTINTFGSYGSGPGQFREPSGVAIDAHGHIVIGDSKNDRLQIFSSMGHYICGVKFSDPIIRPSDIHLTADGHLLVTNFLQHQIKVYKLGEE